MTNTQTTVPFSPIPGHSTPMKYDANKDWTFNATPLMEMSHERYRLAAIRLSSDDVERARGLAQDGLDFEDAYMTRMSAEVKAGTR